MLFIIEKYKLSHTDEGIQIVLLSPVYSSSVFKNMSSTLPQSMTAGTSVFGIMGFPNSGANQAHVQSCTTTTRSFNFCLSSFEISGVCIRIIKTRFFCTCPCNTKSLCPLQFSLLPDTSHSSAFVRSTVPQARWQKPHHKGRSTELLPFSSFTLWTFCNLSMSYLLWTDYHLFLLIN